MTDANSVELSNENTNQKEKEEINIKSEQKTINPTVSDLDDVQSFCAEFHIKVENAAGIRPWLQFSDTNFSEEVLKQFEESEFDMPTPIQSIAWPILSQNRDLVGIASTGSGKTLAFILPLVCHIRKQPPLQPDDGPMAIVLAPTRELVQQIHNVAQPYFNMFGIKSLCIIGGDEREKQINEIGEGKEVYICTPGRLEDFLESKITTLYRVNFIVLDEADKMLDLGFETQVRNILADFKTTKSADGEEQQARQQAQISMFSATWPKSIKTLAEDYLTNYVHATVGCLSESHAVNLHIEQIVDFCPNEQQKKQNLFKILDEVCAYAPDRKTIIFVRTRDKVNRLSKDLDQNGYKALLLHGSKSQQLRNEVLKEFRETPNALLLATDVASRGLDVDDVRFVINFDFPTSEAVYIHRIGRTGRSSHCGTAFTFFSNEDARHAPALVHILDEAGATIHPIILQIGRKNGFNKWVANVGIPQYPVYNPDENWPNDNHDNDEDWSNDNYYNNEDLPPTLMSIDLNSFDASQLRAVPVPLLNSNGQPNELDVNTRIKNFQDYKQRCQLLERLSCDSNDGNYSNNQNYYNNYDNHTNNNNRYNGGWSKPGSENHNGRNWNSNNNEWQNKNYDSHQKRSWDNNMPPSNMNKNNQWNGNNNNNHNNYNNGPSNYDQWKPSNQSQPPQPSQPPQQQQQMQQQPQQQQDQQLSDLETNPAIIYAKASSEYHIQYNQYTTALQQAMVAQQSGTPITPQQQQYLITFQQQLQAKQQQLQVMQQAANLQQASILQAAALSAATQNAWNQQANNASQANLSNDLSKSTADAQQNWMQQWVNAGYDASQIAAYQQWYTQMQTAASLAASAALTQPQNSASSYSGMPYSSNNSNQQSATTISAPPTVSSSTASAAQRAYAAYSNRASSS
ncbi:unnamed protein product [Rotaria magnacalcarata]|uniref:RNA helicase n=1 Tax=Rotaria magnacalcarata TaxID=392030 RepID=A0A819ESL3_9BILA|nr:unnamed protein product [Rotaria magnacalcarata]CAF2094951.1 unnamed protein product [Rotaria magnacalcarata]CAF3855804.1 unnamed protein product [Rotaria magnacalcarata]CAF3917033.1 unnamed protein product [Rotaria magnacalcarata]